MSHRRCLQPLTVDNFKLFDIKTFACVGAGQIHSKRIRAIPGWLTDPDASPARHIRHHLYFHA